MVLANSCHEGIFPNILIALEATILDDYSVLHGVMPEFGGHVMRLLETFARTSADARPPRYVSIVFR